MYEKFVQCNQIRNKFVDHYLGTHVPVCHRCSMIECTRIPEVMISKQTCLSKLDQSKYGSTQ